MTDNSSLAEGGGLPTRIITYAWGEKYLEELLSLTLPALLAPGNLPAVAAAVPCELVLLTEERFFRTVLANDTIARIRALCPMRLVSLDDLITEKDKYGMALTYALHRGFSDLGPAMTKTWLMFLNADFVLADGSLRNLLPYLHRGDRLIASPSYCTDAVQARATLQTHIDSATGGLNITPRALANLILNARHNTIRAKTVNQSTYHFQLMDQFYWQVDTHTLLGRQMPVAIVAMRPERFLAEPNSYWDYGLMREFCPESQPTVLGDSDDFLMLELREPEVFRELIDAGPPDLKKIGARMVSWVTEYQRDFAQFPLALHDQDLPQGVEAARRGLDAFVSEVLSHSPLRLPSHIGHPQWTYHRPGFFAKRHAFLSRRLGSQTETAPPTSLSEIDRAWWLLDGKRKARARLQARFERGFQLLMGAQDQGREDGALSRSSTADAPEPPTSVGACADEPLFADLHLAPLANGSDANPIDRWLESTAALERALQAEEADLKRNYEALLLEGPASAVIPDVEIERGAPATGTRTRWTFGQLARNAYHRAFGKLPRATRLSPYWSLLQPLLAIVDAGIAVGAGDGLLVGRSSGLTLDLFETLPGTRVRVSLTGAQCGNIAAAFDSLIPGSKPEFDILVCDLDPTRLANFAKLYETIRPFAREGATIIGFYYHSALGPLPSDLAEIQLEPLEGDAVDIRRLGTVPAARALKLYQRIHRWGSLPAPLRLVAAPLLAAPLSYLASRTSVDADDAERNPAYLSTGVMIRISVRRFLLNLQRSAVVAPPSRETVASAGFDRNPLMPAINPMQTS